MRITALAALVAGCGFNVNPGAPNDAGPDTPDSSTGIPSPRKVVIANAALAQPLDDFPILVPIAGQVDYTKINDPRKDLRFEDAQHNVIDYDVESWNPNGESLVWVRVPHIAMPPSPSYILLYFGANAGTANPAGVWQDYEQVNHFAGNASDVSMNGHDGTANGATMAPGTLGNSALFASAGDKITFAGVTFDRWSAGTIELWLKLNYQTAVEITGEPQILSNNGSLLDGRLITPSTNLAFQIDTKYTNSKASYAHPDLVVNTWTHVAWTFDGDKQRIYRNGVLLLSDIIGNEMFLDTAGPLVLGNSGSASAKMQIDELRISQSALSSEWLAVEQLSMSRGLVSIVAP